MSTLAQINANRENGRKSKGPSTREGKAVSSANARTHGLLSRDVVGPNEDPADFEVLQERLHAELNPVGPLEEELVSRIAALMWRLRRGERVEAGLYAHHYYEVLAKRATKKAREFAKTPLDRTVESQIQVIEPKKYKAAKAERKEHEAKQESETATLGGAFIEDAGKVNAFSKLARYEAAIERSLHRNLHELQRLQAARKGLPIAPRSDIDIDISTDNYAFDEAVNQ